MPSIPASQIVSVVPSVIGAGGSALDLNGLILTTNQRVAIGAVQSFPDQLSVAAFFGALSQEAQLAIEYFLGFDGSTVKPGALLFAQYPIAPVGAWLRGGNVSALTLTALQALTGSLSVTVDGVAKTGASIDLSGATSFSAAAALIETGLSLTELPGAAFTASIATTVMTVTAVASGVLAPLQTVVGASAGTKIVAQLTSTETDGHLGGKGTYTVNPTQTFASGALTTTNPAVVYDSQSGAFQILSSTTGVTSSIGFASGTLAAPLLLGQANGAVISQGAIAGVPAVNMAAVIGVTQNWAAFMTAWEPSASDQAAFAAWNNSQANRYVYVQWTTNAAATVVPDTTTGGALIRAANYNGVVLIYTTNVTAPGAIAAFEMGCFASLDFAATNGRATMKFRTQTGLAAEVVSGVVAKNLQANGYNFYGDYSTSNDDFIFFANGSITGPFEWADSYVNQIWMTASFQLALLSFMVAMKSIPYNQAGYAGIKAACLDPILSFVNFGSIRAGVTLSQAQAVEVNTAAGVAIDSTLSTRGWYLQVIDPAPIVRGARGTPVCNFWYMDGESVQVINLASVEVQ